MSFNDKAPPASGDSDILNHVMRMVIPMRREHNRSLEVRQFMHDVSYAKEIIEQALASKDVRLQEYGAYLSNKMFGPRNNALPQAMPTLSTVPAQSATPTVASAPSTPSAPSPAEEESEAALRARMMAKYKTGLR